MQSAPPYASLDVLVAEDDKASREALQKAVKVLGHSCRAARDGQEAWEMQQNEPADVILSDWRMPRLDGLELCRRTRAGETDGHYTYFVFLTGYDDRDHLIKGMEAGADDYHGKPIDLDELQARLASAGRVLSLYAKLRANNASLRRESQTSFRLARTDALTEVANRLRMNEDVQAIWTRAKRYGHRYGGALCDIDLFKSYNDRFGHLAGDDVLRQVAQVLKKNLREGDGLYRYGGEEFLMTLPEQSLAEASVAMDRVRLEVEKLGIASATGEGAVTISIGLSSLSPADASPEAWLRRVDEALYRAKVAGRNRVIAV